MKFPVSHPNKRGNSMRAGGKLTKHNLKKQLYVIISQKKKNYVTDCVLEAQNARKIFPSRV